MEPLTLEPKTNSTATPAPLSPPVLSPENGDADASRGKRTRLVRIGIVLGVVVVAFILWRVLRGPGIPDSVVALSGRIEGDDSAIASKTSGRILEVRFREGDHVNQGRRDCHPGRRTDTRPRKSGESRGG